MASRTIYFIVAVCCAFIVSCSAHDNLIESIISKTPDCACFNGKPIDCTNIDPVKKAYERLVANNCNTTSGNVTVCRLNADCKRDFALVQGHHDGCPPGTLPSQVAKGYRDYQGWCQNCFTARPTVDGRPKCPQASCHNTNSSTEAYNYLKANCTADCSSDGCADKYRLMYSYTDICAVRDYVSGHGDLSVDFAKGFEDLVSTCSSKGCNAYNETAWLSRYGQANCTLAKNLEAAALAPKSAAGQLHTGAFVPAVLALLSLAAIIFV